MIIMPRKNYEDPLKRLEQGDVLAWGYCVQMGNSRKIDPEKVARSLKTYLEQIEIPKLEMSIVKKVSDKFEGSGKKCKDNNR